MARGEIKALTLSDGLAVSELDSEAPTGIISTSTQTFAGVKTFTDGLRTGASGRIGIGVASPSAFLHIIGGSASTRGILVADSQTDATTKNFAFRMGHYTNAEESVGIIEAASTSTNNTIEYGGGNATVNAATIHNFYTAANHNTTTGTLRLSISSAGVVTVAAGGSLICGLYNSGGITPKTAVTPKITLGVGGTTPAWVSQADTAATRVHMYFEDNSSTAVGNIATTGGGTNFNTTSDYRLKTNEAPLSNALSDVLRIKPLSYEFKHCLGFRHLGVLAHELQEVVPSAVSGEKDGKEMQQVDYSKLVPLLVAAIQELSAEVSSLRGKK